MSVSAAPTFRLGYAPGATPGKWARIWAQRRADVPLDLISLEVAQTAAAVRDGRVDMALTRLPDALGHADPGPHHSISLYEESTVVVVPKDHVLSAAEELEEPDLVDELFLWPLDDPLPGPFRPGAAADHRPATTADAVELVAAGVGLLIVPQSLARLHHRRDLVYRPVVDAPRSSVGLLWPDPTSDLADEFIGIVRGRKPTSSRAQAQAAPKRTAKEKAAAKRVARAAAGTVPGKRGGPKRRRRSGR